jgi:hypothetical protein
LRPCRISMYKPRRRWFSGRGSSHPTSIETVVAGKKLAPFADIETSLDNNRTEAKIWRRHGSKRF